MLKPDRETVGWVVRWKWQTGTPSGRAYGVYLATLTGPRWRGRRGAMVFDSLEAARAAASTSAHVVADACGGTAAVLRVTRKRKARTEPWHFSVNVPDGLACLYHRDTPMGHVRRDKAAAIVDALNEAEKKR